MCLFRWSHTHRDSATSSICVVANTFLSARNALSAWAPNYLRFWAINCGEIRSAVPQLAKTLPGAVDTQQTASGTIELY